MVDFGIVVEPVDLSKYDFISLPSKDEWGVLMRKDCPLAFKKSVQVSDLIDKPMILPSQAIEPRLSRNEFTEWFGDDFNKLKIVTTYNLLNNAAIMVREGFGYAVTFDNIVYTGEYSDLCFRPLNPRVESGLILILKKYQVFSPAAKLFLEVIKFRFS